MVLLFLLAFVLVFLFVDCLSALKSVKGGMAAFSGSDWLIVIVAALLLFLLGLTVRTLIRKGRGNPVDGAGPAAKNAAEGRALSQSDLTYLGKARDTVRSKKAETPAREPSFLDSVFSHSGGLTNAESSAHSSRINGRTEYYDRKSKKRIGSSVSYGGKTTYYDEKGRKTGTSSVSYNGTVTYRDSKGKKVGTARRNGRTTEYYDADKHPIGRSERGSSGEEFVSYRRH